MTILLRSATETCTPQALRGTLWQRVSRGGLGDGAFDTKDALKQGFALIAGAVGVGAAARTMGGSGDAQPAASAPAAPVLAGTTVLTFHGRNLHGFVGGRPPGTLPEQGDRVTARGELLDGPGGKPVGEFFAAGFTLETPGRFQASNAGLLELHTFNLPDGTIIGTGTPTHGPSADTFAILGGTGRYAGARGTYEARQDHQEFGGDGTAEFTLTLLP